MQYNETPTYPGHTPAKKRRRWVLPTALTIGGFLIGGGIATAAQPEPETVMIEKPVEVEKVVTETVTEEVEVTPEACITALDLSGSALVLGGEVIGHQSEALMIASDILGNPFAADQASIDRIVELTGYIEDATAEMEAMTPDAGAASSECRGE